MIKLIDEKFTTIKFPYFFQQTFIFPITKFSLECSTGQEFFLTKSTYSCHAKITEHHVNINLRFNRHKFKKTKGKIKTH